MLKDDTGEGLKLFWEDYMAKKVETQLETLRRDNIPAIQKALGDDAIRVGILNGAVKCEVIPTGCMAIDIATGVGGIPRGRIIEIYGPESSGKTTLALTIAAQAQKAGGVAAMVDAEHCLDPQYTAALGVNLDDLLFSQPDTGEQALEIVEKLTASNLVDVIIVDSVAALTPKKILEGELGDNTIGLQAQLMSKALSRLKGEVRKSRTCVIFTNQLRDKIGVMTYGGDHDQTPGGRALKFYASMRIDIRRVGSMQDAQDGPKVGNEVRIKIAKNKVAPPFKEARFQIVFGKGISNIGSLVDIAVEHDIIKKSGTWLSYDHSKWGGKSQAVKFLENNIIIKDEIDKKIREKLLAKTIEGKVEEESNEQRIDGVETTSSEVQSQ
jgi:recombination protein RecA